MTYLSLTDVKVTRFGSSQDWLRGDSEDNGSSVAEDDRIKPDFSGIAGQLSVRWRLEDLDWLDELLPEFSLVAAFEINSLEGWVDPWFLFSVL